MRQKVVLVTGANGEIGHGLIKHLAKLEKNIVALDVVPWTSSQGRCAPPTSLGISWTKCFLAGWAVEHGISTIYHLASILSTKAEYNPETAHRINVEGTLNSVRPCGGTIPR